MAAYSITEMTQICLARMEKKTITYISSPTSESRFIAQALTAAHQWINGIHHWDWLRKEGEVALVPPVAQTASISTTEGATAISWGTTVGAAAATYNIYDGGVVSLTNLDVLRLDDVTSGTGGTLKAASPHTTSAIRSGSISQDTYSLPADFDRPITSGSFVTAPWKMTSYDPERFLKLRNYDTALLPSFTTTAQPDSYTIWGNGDGAQKLMVWPFPSAAQTISIRYIKKASNFSTDGAIPDIPEKYQNVLIYRALDLYYRDKELDMTKRSMFHAQFQQILQSMLGTVERTSDRLAMVPNTGRQQYSA